MNPQDVKQMVDTLEALSKRIRAEVGKGDAVDWNKMKGYMDQREELIKDLGKSGSMPLREQERIRKILEQDRQTISRIEEMKDKVAAQMRRLGNREAGKVLDTKG